MSSLLQPHASDCEQDNSSKLLPTIVEFESTFEVEATKSVETDKEEGIFLTWEGDYFKWKKTNTSRSKRLCKTRTILSYNGSFW